MFGVRKDPEIQGNRTHDEKSKLKLPQNTHCQSQSLRGRLAMRKGVNAPGERRLETHAQETEQRALTSEFHQHAETHGYNQRSKQASHNNLQSRSG